MTFEVPDPNDLPDAVLTATGNLSANQMVTSDNAAWLIDSLGVTPRWNVMAQAAVLEHEHFQLTDRGQAAAMTVLEDMALRVRMKDLGRFRDVVGVLAQQNPFHPFEDYLERLEWDGVDRLAELAATVETPTPSWPVYLKRWLVQVCEAACGWREGKPRSLPHVLIFAGKQGQGKATWFANLLAGVDEAYLSDAQLHLDKGTAKDDQLAALSRLVVELSEIDTTFRKSDMGALKAFLSRTEDMLRAPYARRHERRIRSTVFCGSVNNIDFLMDETGSRRYWPVEVERIVWDHGVDFDQVWAQAYALWCEGEPYILTAAENEQRVKEAEDFAHVYTEEEMLEDYFDEDRMATPKTTWLPLTRTDICRILDISLAPAVGSRVTAWLTANFGRKRKIQGKKYCWLMPVPVSHLNKPKGPSIKVPKTYLKDVSQPRDDENGQQNGPRDQ